MWGIDVSHTAHTGAQTGIQHVCRDLLKCFMAGAHAIPVVYDPYFRCWREPDNRENNFLFPERGFQPPSARSGKWSRWQKLRGRLGHQFGKHPASPACDLLFCPELFDVKRDAAIFSGPWSPDMPKVAYFYDAIPFRFPQWTPNKTVLRYPGYLRTLARFDHVACISRASEADLHAAWESLEVRNVPPTSAIPLGLPLDRVNENGLEPDAASHPVPVVLMVGTLEARKNHMAVLEACQSLWETGIEFELRLIGMLNKETGQQAAQKISELKDLGHSIVWEGAVSNERLARAYGEADLFLYPSLHEGFGLPVLESIEHGLPTITTRNGALAELADGGGCLVCEDTPGGIAKALNTLLTDQDLFDRLKTEAVKRPVRSMEDTAGELEALFQELAGKPRS